MDPSSGHNQEMSSDSLGNMLVGSKPQTQQERKPRPHPEQALKCPRCDSINTKFCYYNNYSLSQPRYFCKACRRYWTKGGTLRNVPVGGGCRRNKRSSSSSSSSSLSSSKRVQDNPLTPNPNPLTAHLPPLLGHAYDSNDLTLAFARLQKQSCGGQLGFEDHHHDLSILGNHDHLGITNLGINNSSSSSSSPAGFLDALRNGFLESQNHSGANSFGNLYYGYGNNSATNSIGDDHDQVENGITSVNGVVSGDNHNMGLGYDHHHQDDQIMISNNNGTTTAAVTVTTIKQELCQQNNNQENSNRVLWGCPWQLNNGSISSDIHQYHGMSGMGDIDHHGAGRESWNGLASSWHGLLNSTPLM